MNIDPRITFDHAQVGGVNLHYAKAGEGRDLVILLHGFPESWYSWRHQLAALSDYYTVVAPDMRGFNLSDKPNSVSDYATEKLVDDVIGLIHHFGHEKAAVIGHDWGASVAWAMASKHPEYLTKIGSLQVPPASVLRKNFGFRQFLASWYVFFFQLPWLPEFVLSLNDFAMLKRAMTETTAEKNVFSDEDIAVFEKGWKEPGALTAMLNYYRANIAGRFLSRKPEAKITVPTLFIYGQQDTAVLPETVRNIGSVIDAEFEEFFVPLSGHWIQQEVPEVVNQILKEFLAK